jgi:hypothetical protein
VLVLLAMTRLAVKLLLLRLRVPLSISTAPPLAKTPPPSLTWFVVNVLFAMVSVVPKLEMPPPDPKPPSPELLDPPVA